MPRNLSADRPIATRPTDEEKVNRIIKSIAAGCPYKIACGAAAYSYSAFKTLMIQGENDLKAGSDTYSSRCYAKLHELEETELLKGLGSIRFSDNGHKGEQWYIAKKHWQHYSEKAETIALAEKLEELQERVDSQEAERINKD